MGLRWKIALSLAAVALVATLTVGLISYRTTSARLLDEVDRSISQATGQMIGRAVDGRITMPTRSLLEVYSVRVLDATGESVASSFPDDAPIADGAHVGGRHATALATGRRFDVDDESYRVHTIGLADGALQIARPLDEVDSVLSDLRQRTLLLVVLVSVGAALVGWLIAGTVAAPIRRLTGAAEDVGSSGRLDVEVPGTGTDEVGRLGLGVPQHARCARGVPRRTAAAGAGRRPRTAHTAHQPEDQPVGAASSSRDVTGDARRRPRRSRHRGDRTHRTGQRTRRGRLR